MAERSKGSTLGIIILVAVKTQPLVSAKAATINATRLITGVFIHSPIFLVSTMISKNFAILQSYLFMAI
ncbi:MAG: hypothetical protein HOI52_02575 [Rhodospirillales bacterium]|nr:hypothetical protein [Rhodospirillales bacterium]MBT5673372.1 hypothetical protein [Rhodospirillales bacterium]MBT6186031.1 hypothetical protein [Rhodospirillales bacterium]MBT6742405.1 hypothetical protein [Rhodospirillales bacterium]